MKIALLGLPQSGKRTLFRLLTGRRVPQTRKAGEPVEGVAPIRDPRVDVLARIFQPRKVTPAENQFVLCPDLEEGVKMQSALDIARRCDLLCLVVRAFEAEHVYHPAGSVDAERDRGRLEMELIFADLERVMNRLLRIEKEKQRGLSPDQAIEERALGKCSTILDQGQPLTAVELASEEEAAIRSLGLLTRRPLLWTYNVSEEYVAGPHPPGVFAVSAKIEDEIAAIEDSRARREFLTALGVDSGGLDRMNAAAYDATGLMSFYTTGKDEVRAWTIRKGSRAPQAGAKIHSDIARGFIRVEIVKYDDIVAAGSEKAAKEQGRVQLRGKDYVIEDGDTCHFLFNVSR